jgi:thiol-disulfide isomerase/thioredoxin
MRLLAAALLLAVSLLAQAQPDSAALFAASLPDRNNQTVALADLRGKPLIVNFWARWCLPCREEIPELKAIAQNWRPQGLTVVGIGLEDNRPNVQDFIKAYEMDYPLFFAPAQGIELMMALGNNRAGLPFTLAINREGRVVMHKLGKISRAELEAAAAAALK